MIKRLQSLLILASGMVLFQLLYLQESSFQHSNPLYAGATLVNPDQELIAGKGQTCQDPNTNGPGCPPPSPPPKSKTKLSGSISNI